MSCLSRCPYFRETTFKGSLHTHVPMVFTIAGGQEALDIAQVQMDVACLPLHFQENRVINHWTGLLD